MESNSLEESQGNEAAKLEVVLNYCIFHGCRGIPFEAEVDKNQSDCSICYSSFDSSKVAIFNPCKHMFCYTCVAKSKTTSCHMCRRPVKDIHYFNKPILTDLSKIDFKQHKECLYPTPVIKEYLKELNVEWQALATFMMEVKITERCETIKGTGVLNLQNHQNEGRILHKGNNVVVLKSTEEETQIVICAIWANFSMRLILTKQNNFDFDVDNEYADHVATVLNKQLAICWRIIPNIIDRRSYDHLYVRKFENITCSLLLCGFEDIGLFVSHSCSMRQEFSDLKDINFDKAEYNRIRDTFPPLLLAKLRTFHEPHYCRKSGEHDGYKKYTLEEIYDLAHKNGQTGLPKSN